ncbi:hypothetical protein NL676_003679 [Syzygium grande]|nr:hypothetical protein NL676_003679 [Syzygium grande]
MCGFQIPDRRMRRSQTTINEGATEGTDYCSLAIWEPGNPKSCRSWIDECAGVRSFDARRLEEKGEKERWKRDWILSLQPPPS